MLKIRAEKGKIIIESDRPFISEFKGEYRMDIDREILMELFRYCMRDLERWLGKTIKFE